MFNHIAIIHQNPGSVHYGVALLVPTFFILDNHSAVSIHHSEGVLCVGDILDIPETKFPRILRHDCGLRFDFAGCSSNMKRPHSKLCPRFTDGLSRYHSHSLPEFNQLTRAKVSPITFDTHATRCFACESRPNMNRFNACRLNSIGQFFSNFLIAHNDGLSGDWI